VKVEVTDDGSVKRAVKRHGDAMRGLRDMRTPLSRAAVFLDKWVRANFKTQGGKVGGWAPFKDGGRWVRKSQVRGSVRKFQSSGPRAGSGRRTGTRVLDSSARLLQDTRRLYGSFVPFVRRDTAGIGSDVPYAEKHEKGDRSKNLPARRMLPAQREVRRDIDQIFERSVDEARRKEDGK